MFFLTVRNILVNWIKVFDSSCYTPQTLVFTGGIQRISGVHWMVPCQSQWYGAMETMLKYNGN